MPTHGILPVSVEIAQNAIKRLSTSVFNGLFEVNQRICPRLWKMCQAGILVDRAFVAMPAYHAGDGDAPTNNSGYLLLPLQFSP